MIGFQHNTKDAGWENVLNFIKVLKSKTSIAKYKRDEINFNLPSIMLEFEILDFESLMRLKTFFSPRIFGVMLKPYNYITNIDRVSWYNDRV